MRTYNRATIIGHVGNEVVVRHTSEGRPVVVLSIATTERTPTGVATTWHRVVLQNRLAELAERFLRKGQAVYVEGKMATREWVDADGVRHVRVEVMAQEMVFIDGQGDEGEEPPGWTTALDHTDGGQG